MQLLNTPLPEQLLKEILGCLRILSRDKKDLNDLVCGQHIDVLLKHAGIVSQEEALKLINEKDTFEGIFYFVSKV